MERKNVSSGSPYEKPIGFSRAVRIGNIIAVSATAPIDKDGSTACVGDLYGQTKHCLGIVVRAIESAGGRSSDTIRTRVFLRDVRQWQEAAKAHGEIFESIRPSTTFVEVSGFINPEWLVEIEADCIL